MAARQLIRSSGQPVNVPGRQSMKRSSTTSVQREGERRKSSNSSFSDVTYSLQTLNNGDVTVRLDELPKQTFNYFLVIDFQATCEVHNRAQPDPREIIEVSVAKVDSRTFGVDAIFHQYVCPSIHKKLTKFCTQLTGISQCMVDGQPELITILRKLQVWMRDQGLFRQGISFVPVTHNEWFLKQLLPRNIYYLNSNSDVPDYFKKWINLSKDFQSRTGIDPTDEIDSLLFMLKRFDLRFEGPRHSGVYVCQNIIRILRSMALHNQAVFYINSP